MAYRRIPGMVLGICFGRFGLLAFVLAAQTTAVNAGSADWIKGADGDWSEWGSWSNAPGYSDDIWIPKGTVTLRQYHADYLDIPVFTQVKDVSIGSNGGLVVASPLTASGDLISSGQLNMDLRLAPDAGLNVQGKTWLRAGGVTTLNGASYSRRAWIASPDIVVESGHVVRGSFANFSTLKLDNRGSIEAEAGQLTLGDSDYGGSIVNSGTIRAINRGSINGAYIAQNSGGLVEIFDGSVGNSISGGVIRGHGASSGLAGALANTTLQGEFRFGSVRFWGPVQNNARLNLIDGATYERYSADAVTEGRGEWLLASGGKVNLKGMNFGSGQRFQGGATVVSGGLINQGTFIVQEAHGLVLDNYASDNKIVNLGNMTIAEGSRLVLYQRTFNNTGGTLTFQGVSDVAGWNGQNFSAWIVGGTVVGSGAQRVTGQLSFQDLTLDGRWTSAGSGTIGLKGRVVINGSLVVGDGKPGSGGKLNIVADTVLDGTGETVLVGGDPYQRAEVRTNDYSGHSSNARLTVGSQHTLRGDGVISPSVQIQGLVQADLGQRLQFNSTVVNQGTMRANGGGILVGGDGVVNHGGLIEVSQGATVQAYAGSIQGGVIRGVGEGGRLRVRELRDVTLEGRLGASDSPVWDGGSIGVSGTINNHGILHVGGADENGTVFGTMLIRTTATLGGRGVTQVGADHGPAIMGQCCGSTLTVDSGHTLRGAGSIQYLDVINRGTVLAQGGLLSFGGGHRLVNQGLLQVETDATLRTDGELVQEGHDASLLLNGRIEASQLLLSGGTLEGNGTLLGNLRVEAASLKIGRETGSLTVDGDLLLGDGSLLAFTLGDALPELSTLVVTGEVSLAGALSIDVGAWGELGATFDILRGAGGVRGEFSGVNLVGTSLKASVAYLGDRVSISLVSSVPEPSALALVGFGLLASGALSRRAPRRRLNRPRSG